MQISQNHFHKSTSPFIYKGEMHFHTQKRVNSRIHPRRLKLTGIYTFLNSSDPLQKAKKKCDILLTVFGRIPSAQKKNNQKECRAVNDTKIASKAKHSLQILWVKFLLSCAQSTTA